MYENCFLIWKLLWYEERFLFLINKWNQIIAFRGIDAEERNEMEFYKILVYIVLNLISDVGDNVDWSWIVCKANSLFII